MQHRLRDFVPQMTVFHEFSSWIHELQTLRQSLWFQPHFELKPPIWASQIHQSWPRSFPPTIRAESIRMTLSGLALGSLPVNQVCRVDQMVQAIPPNEVLGKNWQNGVISWYSCFFLLISWNFIRFSVFLCSDIFAFP